MPALIFRASIVPGSLDEEARTVGVTWTTGARVQRGGWFSDPYWEKLSLDPKHVRLKRLNNGAPFLDSHAGWSTSSVIGVVVNGTASVDGKKGTATVRFAKPEDDPDADKIFRKVKDGILQNVSVGYRVHKMEEQEKLIEKMPVRLAVDWEPYEISVVPMGADDGAGFRSGDGTALNPCVFTRSTTASSETRIMADEIKPETKPAPALPPAQAELNAVASAANDAAAHRRSDQEAAEKLARERSEQARKEERERIATIHSLVERTDLGSAFAEKMVRDGASVDAVRAVVIERLTKTTEGGPDGRIRILAGDDASEKFIRGGCASIFQRTGTTPLIEAAKKDPRFAEQFRDVSTDPGEFRGMKIIDLARAALERRGVSTKGLYGDALVKRAIEYRDAGMNTTSDLIILLETAVNKTFLGQYAITPVTWPRWCGRKSVQDFRTATFYRPGSFGVLDAVSEAGEIKHKNIPDGEKATLTPSTKGNIIGLTRKAMVNDDLGAFQNLAAGLGQAAAFSVEGDAFALIHANAGLGPTQADGQPLFHSNRSNIGGAGAMSVDTWDSAASVMAAQKDVSKNLVLDLSPAVWIGPRSMLLKARTLNANATDPTSNKLGVANPVQNMVRDVIGTARLPGAGGTATRHYFLADPGLYPVFAVGFIDGQEAPQITSRESFEIDGLQIRIVFDYGVAVLDYRGAVASPGA